MRYRIDKPVIMHKAAVAVMAVFKQQDQSTVFYGMVIHASIFCTATARQSQLLFCKWCFIRK